jgi:hypothetical protein
MQAVRAAPIQEIQLSIGGTVSTSFMKIEVTFEQARLPI